MCTSVVSKPATVKVHPKWARIFSLVHMRTVPLLVYLQIVWRSHRCIADIPVHSTDLPGPTLAEYQALVGRKNSPPTLASSSNCEIVQYRQIERKKKIRTQDLRIPIRAVMSSSRSVSGKGSETYMVFLSTSSETNVHCLPVVTTPLPCSLLT